jgi:hypothetical protein
MLTASLQVCTYGFHLRGLNPKADLQLQGFEIIDLEHCSCSPIICGIDIPFILKEWIFLITPAGTLLKAAKL